MSCQKVRIIIHIYASWAPINWISYNITCIVIPKSHIPLYIIYREKNKKKTNKKELGTEGHVIESEQHAIYIENVNQAIVGIGWYLKNPNPTSIKRTAQPCP